jgi:hypothetical protein
MNTEIAENIIIKAIADWSAKGGKLVIGIEGYSGSGKTTILKRIAEKCSFILPIYMDDFVSTANTKNNKTILKNDLELELTWSPVDGLEKLRTRICNFKSISEDNKVLVVEGIFLFRKDVIGDLLDKRIYLDCDNSEADKRRIKREKERWGKKYFPEDHPDSFTKYFKLAFNKHEENFKPKREADLIVMVD